MDAPAWISAISAVIAVLTTTIGVVLTSKHEKGANEAAANAAESASSMADAQTRIADSLEEERQQAAKLIPNWEITHRTGMLYSLENCCGEDAINVVVETGSLKDSRLEKSLLPAGSSIEICGVFDMGSSSIVRVTWNRLPETNDTKSYLWEGTFPPRQG